MSFWMWHSPSAHLIRCRGFMLCRLLRYRTLRRGK